ncbi:MAG: YvcK family protein [Candidatus Saccharibacteria bacterium]|nr:YvcK family protein [Candidatus Saccharibacteria bacterium]
MNNNPFKSSEVKIAVIGGGTGSSVILSAFKKHTSQIAALINMVDDGGSTGQLRDELGVLPPGDIRQCLAALSRFPEVRDLFNYRFEAGSFKGHAFGNIFLTALEKMKGDFGEGVKLASKVLNIIGVVEPITLDDIHLVIEDNGVIIKGEYRISETRFDKSRPKIWLEPSASANPVAIGAIMNADMVIVAPGGLYGSLAPALLVNGVGEALEQTKALKVYVCNLMTKPGQTDNFMVHDFADEIERFAGVNFLDVVLFNTELPSGELIEKYARDNERPVKYNEKKLLNKKYHALGAKLLSRDIWQPTSKSDPIAASRTLIRHDPDLIAETLLEIYRTYRK